MGCKRIFFASNIIGSNFSLNLPPPKPKIVATSLLLRHLTLTEVGGVGREGGLINNSAAPLLSPPFLC